MVQFQGKQRHEMVRLVLRQVASALAYLQGLQIAHRDLKPENVLVVGPSQIQVADFGWACWWKPGQWNTTLCGTPEYVPPECLAHPRRYHAWQVDSWALGVLAWELHRGYSPFHVEDSSTLGEDQTRHAIFDKIRRFKGISLPCAPLRATLMDDFCGALLQVEPDRRLEAPEVLEHPLLFQPRQSQPHACGRASHHHHRHHHHPPHPVTPEFSAQQPSPTVAQRCQLFQPTSTSQIHCL